ncbi:hypothetical protein FRX31_011039 [Thalictrum thalictroides]|uniref:DUF4283 domain-containing protein n=1 Tax=Thalictrum thalictroides TaxID=46969 RepID=A0A7J6WQY3_THATH|nr:hypothetical protein FRX31_011039 [Thalictrum thalictroides]
MQAYGDTMFTFKFGSEEEKGIVLEIGSFHVASQLFIVRPWKLFVVAEMKEMKIVPIWVILKGYPMELWDRKGFSKVGSTISVQLFVDKLTEERRRTAYARMCIEVDTNCKFYKDVTVVFDQKKAFTIPVEYN